MDNCGYGEERFKISGNVYNSERYVERPVDMLHPVLWKQDLLTEVHQTHTV